MSRSKLWTWIPNSKDDQVVPLSRGCETAREPKGSRRSLLDISDVPIELVASHCSLHTLFVRACSRQCLKFLLAVVFLPEGRPRRHAEGKLYQAASCPSQDAGAATRTRDQRHAMASAWLGDQAVAMACAGPDTSSKIPPASRERRGEERLPTAHLAVGPESRSSLVRPSVAAKAPLTRRSDQAGDQESRINSRGSGVTEPHPHRGRGCSASVGGLGVLALTPDDCFGRSPDRLRSTPRSIVDSENDLNACIQSVRKNFLTLDWVCP